MYFFYNNFTLLLIARAVDSLDGCILGYYYCYKIFPRTIDKW